MLHEYYAEPMHRRMFDEHDAVAAQEKGLAACSVFCLICTMNDFYLQYGVALTPTWPTVWTMSRRWARVLITKVRVGSLINCGAQCPIEVYPGRRVSPFDSVETIREESTRNFALTMMTTLSGGKPSSLVIFA